MAAITDKYRLINGAELSNEIPETQQLKINNLRSKHYPLFYSYSQKFAILLKKLEPK